MNKHSADATTAEEALAIQETLDSNMATEVAMKNTPTNSSILHNRL